MACELLLWDVSLLMCWACEIDCNCTNPAHKQ